MRTPAPRIWLYPLSMNAVEIIILGARVEAAKIYAQLANVAKDWGGWLMWEPIGTLDDVIGMCCVLGQNASHDEALLEAYRMMSAYSKVREIEGQRPIEWCDGMKTAVGTW